MLAHPDNAEVPFPLILTGPKSAKDYLSQVNRFILDTLGLEAQQRYKIIIDDPEHVAVEIKKGMRQVREFRKQKNDLWYYNWYLTIDESFQKPFNLTHENTRGLSLIKNQDQHLLAANMRRAFSGVVAGNVKQQGIAEIKKKGVFELVGDAEIMQPVDELLQTFVKQQRMKLPGKSYALLSN
jgi:pyrimidine/purine-5'-nucleotide nucleosidase